jgi:hypothetical protein
MNKKKEQLQPPPTKKTPPFLKKFWIPLLIAGITLVCGILTMYDIYKFYYGDPLEPEFCFVQHTPTLSSRVSRVFSLSGTYPVLKIESIVDGEKYESIMSLDEETIYYKYIDKNLIDVTDPRNEAERVCEADLKLESEGDTLFIGKKYYSYDNGMTFYDLDRFSETIPSWNYNAVDRYFQKKFKNDKVDLAWADKLNVTNCRVQDKDIVCDATNIEITRTLPDGKTVTSKHTLLLTYRQYNNIEITEIQ